MTKEELWQAALAEIELSISKATFVTWFRNTSISAQKNGGVVVSVPNGFSKEWLENKFNKLILKTLRNISPDVKEISFIIESNKQAGAKSQRLHKKPFDFPLLADQLSFEQFSVDKETNLNPKYTFDNYIVGASNELAHAASSSVAQNPGKEYNPLFIYGGVGLGKTHLLQAVGNTIREKHPKAKIQYLTCEKFTNDFINAIRAQKIKEFRENYRKLDLLIIDDVQFITHKERTQEEFFHTFNTLFESNRQIILSSDRSPKAIDSLEERLRSRFQGGMIADIGYPDYEMRVAILRAKVKEKNVELPATVVEYIAEHIQNNIRELEGTLNVLLASSKMGGAEITLEKTKKYLDPIIKRPRRIVSLKKVLKAAANFYDISEKDILSQNRKRDIARPRQVVMYLLREDLKYSYPLIGTKIGGRDHTTVIHACSKISQELKDNNEDLAEELNLIKQDIYNS
jgi:chromosomal replication initiator protein